MEFFRELRLTAAIVVALYLASVASAALAADFEISLQVKSAKQQAASKFTEVEPSLTKPHPRPVLTIGAKETVFVSWKALNGAKPTTCPNVLIHGFVVEEKTPGQIAVPDLQDPAQESALTMDFKPGDSATGEFSLKLDKPGAYLVRVETQNLFAKYGHEYYGALDLVCK